MIILTPLGVRNSISTRGGAHAESAFQGSFYFYFSTDYYKELQWILVLVLPLTGLLPRVIMSTYSATIPVLWNKSEIWETRAVLVSFDETRHPYSLVKWWREIQSTTQQHKWGSFLSLLLIAPLSLNSVFFGLYNYWGGDRLNFWCNSV